MDARVDLPEEALRDRAAAPALVETMRAALDRTGALILPRLFDPARVGRLARALAGWLAAEQARGGGRAIGVGDRRFMISLPLAPPLCDEDLVADPLLLSLLGALLGPGFALNSYGAVLALPGAAAQPRHKDHEPLFDDPALPPHAVTVVIPLVDLDDICGGTALCLGTHRGADAGEPLVAQVRRGGAYLMDYRLSHFGTANRSGAVRPILYIVYALPWFVDERNFYHLPALDLPEGAAPAPALAPLVERVRRPPVRLG